MSKVYWEGKSGYTFNIPNIYTAECSQFKNEKHLQLARHRFHSLLIFARPRHFVQTVIIFNPYLHNIQSCK
jgi:hypothetical protein